MALYSIRDWQTHFEKSQTRKVEKASWVPLPNKHDGKSFRRLMRRPNGCEIFGAWVLLIEVASKCPERGVLADDDGPLTPDDLHDKTGCPASVFREAMQVLASQEIGWLLVDGSQTTPTKCAIGQDRTLQDRKGQEKGAAAPPTDEPSPAEKPAKVKPEEIAIPGELDTPEFLVARDAWFKQRRQKRLSLRPDYVTGQYARLLPLGPANAAACLLDTVANDYDGIFPAKFINGPPQYGKPKQPSRVGGGQRFKAD